MRFGEYVKVLREAKGLTITLAAKELGMSPQKLCDIEQSRRNFSKHPPAPLLRKMAAVYDHPFANLVLNTEFFHYEKTIVDDLFREFEPVLKQLDRITLDMHVEAKQYTPEMEGLTGKAQDLVSALKLSLSLAKAKISKPPQSP